MINVADVCHTVVWDDSHSSLHYLVWYEDYELQVDTTVSELRNAEEEIVEYFNR